MSRARYKIYIYQGTRVVYDRKERVPHKATDYGFRDCLNLDEKLGFRFAIYPKNGLRGIRISYKVLVAIEVFAALSSTIMLCFLLSFMLQGGIDISPSCIPLVPLIMIAELIVHELSHAVVGASLGGLILEIGFNRDLLFKCQTVMIWKNRTPCDAIIYYSAGVTSSMLIAVLSGIAYCSTGSDMSVVISIYSYVAIVVDLLPVRRTSDGSHIIHHLTKCRNGIRRR